MKNFALVIIIVLVAFKVEAQEDWNQYLGPDRKASLKNANILRSWPEEGPNKLWSFELGQGYGGASIIGDEVFVLDRITGKKDILRCIDLNTGEEKWQYAYDAPGEIPYPGSRAVPTVDNQYVWTAGPFGHFTCVSRETHQAVWSHNLLNDFDAKLPKWGVSQSPVIYKDLIIVAPQGNKAGVVAFNKLNGKVVWKSRKLTGHNAYVSLVLAKIDGVDQVIIISPYDKNDSETSAEVVAFNASDGTELWKYLGLRSFLTITPPTVIDDNRIFLTDCSYNDKYGPVSIMLDIKRKDNNFTVTELFKTEKAGNKMHPAVLFENHLYMNNNGRPSQMTCMNLDGEVLWTENTSPNFGLGALILIDGLIMNQNGKNGDLYLIDPSPSAYKEIAKASLFKNQKPQAWSPLAFSKGKLLIRNMEEMLCIDIQNR
ncbi:PQQ-binding-like beta-propeller repeat protein [Bacteroidota bacterium]